MIEMIEKSIATNKILNLSIKSIIWMAFTVGAMLRQEESCTDKVSCTAESLDIISSTFYLWQAASMCEPCSDKPFCTDESSTYG